MAAIYPADTFQEGVDLTIEASNQLAQVVRGDANTEVMVADGSTIPSIRKAQADSMYFKEPEAWTTGQTETDYLQLKKYIDPTTNKESWWFAKGALASNPIAMGTSPFGDDNWTLYTPEDLFISGKAEYESVYQALKGKAAEAGYNLVRGSFEEGGTLTNINDVLWYQANGKYYNWYNGSAKTVVAGSTPATSGGVGDGAWVDRSGDVYSGVEERLLGVGAKIYRGSNGQYVQNGDVVPAETTHLRVLINGKVEDVAMSPIASGAVSLLTDTSATIGVTQVNFNLINSLIFSSVKSLKHPPIQSSLLDLYDVKAKTTSYHGGWSVLLRPIGGGEYILTTKQKVRDALGDPTWEPDGYSDHYLFGGSTYVAMLIHNGVNNIQQFGAKGNGLENDTPPINAACQKVKENGLPVYAPGTGNFYLMDNDGFQVRVTGLEVDFVLYGDGETSKFKRGDGTANGDFHELFKVSNLSGSKVNVTFKDFFVDDNARGSVAPASPYAYEHSHALVVLPIGARGFLNVRFENISAIDAVADICSVGGGSVDYVGDIVVSGVITKDRTRTRSDITVTCSYDNLSAINCVVDKFEVETNSVASDSLGELKVTNVTCRNAFDVIYKSHVTNAEINNLSVGGYLNLHGYNAKISNSHLNLSGTARLVGSSTLSNSLVFSNTEITINPDFSSEFGMYIETSATSPRYVEFNTCKFKNPNNVPLNRFWSDNNSAFEGRVVAFINTDFECESNMQEAAFFRSGEYEFINCSFSGAIVKDSYVRQFDAKQAITNRVLLDSNNVRESGKYLYEPAVDGSVDITCKDNSAPLPGYIVGLTRYDKIATPRGIGSVLNFIQVDHFESNGTPTSGRFITGQRCYYQAPMPGGAEGVVATTSGEVGGAVVFKEFGSIAV